MADRVDLDALEALEREGTPRPWEDEHDRNAQPNIYPVGDHARWIALLPHQCVTSIERQANADAALIIAMRNALPALLAELRALRAVAEAAAVFRRVEELVDSTPRNHNLKIADALGEKIAARTALIEALAALDATKGGGS